MYYMDIQQYNYISTNEKIHWGYLFKNTVFKWWFGDGLFRNSCLMRKSGVPLKTQVLSSFDILLPFLSPTRPVLRSPEEGPYLSTAWKDYHKGRNPLRVKSHGWFPKRLSLSVGCTHLPFSLQVKGIMYFFPIVPFFPLGKHRLDLVFWFPAINHYHMAWFP